MSTSEIFVDPAIVFEVIDVKNTPPTTDGKKTLIIVGVSTIILLIILLLCYHLYQKSK